MIGPVSELSLREMSPVRLREKKKKNNNFLLKSMFSNAKSSIWST